MYFQRTKMLREEFGYTQNYVAKYLKCSRSTYANWESGYIMLPLDIASKLSILYGVSISYVLGVNSIKHNDMNGFKIDYTFLKKKLNELKKTNNNSYEEIALYTNVHLSTASRYFNGKIKVPTDKLILLCQFYNIEIEELCCEKI